MQNQPSVSGREPLEGNLEWNPRAAAERCEHCFGDRQLQVGPEIEHAGSEFDYAKGSNAQCGIVVGQEFTKVTPEKLSFWWAGRAAFRQAALDIAEAYGQSPQFRGLSVNDMNAYLAARE